MPASQIAVDPAWAGQRIDNYLIRRLHGLPKSRLYRALRRGEVRVNSRRVKPEYRLQAGDIIRIPPLQTAPQPQQTTLSTSLAKTLEARIMYEDRRLIMINKPSALPVHGGSGINQALIETLRKMRPKLAFLELVHRLDRETSGCLLIAKKRSLLLELHRLLTHRQINKQYLALVKGHWPANCRQVDVPLKKQQLSGGERIVKVSSDGKPAVTRFRPLHYYNDATLVAIQLKTGRTHQIRVHTAYAGHPIAGDSKYGSRQFNKIMAGLGLKRLFLHAASLDFQLTEPSQHIAICAPLDSELLRLLKQLSQK